MHIYFFLFPLLHPLQSECPFPHGKFSVIFNILCPTLSFTFSHGVRVLSEEVKSPHPQPLDGPCLPTPRLWVPMRMFPFDTVILIYMSIFLSSLGNLIGVRGGGNGIWSILRSTGYVSLMPFTQTFGIVLPSVRTRTGLCYTLRRRPQHIIMSSTEG